jgi:ABC-type Fe3+ transport system substrate-binding protein
MRVQLVSLPLAFCGVLAQWQPKVPLETRSLDAIYAEAREEAGNGSQPLQVAWGGDDGTQSDSVRQAWKQRFPGIPLNLTVDLSKYHNGRIDKAFYAGQHLADVAFLQTLQDFPRWKKQNRLLYYKPVEFDDIFNGEKDPDGAWAGFFNCAANLSQTYTTYPTAGNLENRRLRELFLRQLQARCLLHSLNLRILPRPILEIKAHLDLPERRRCRAYLFSLIVSKYGHSWLENLAANDVQWVKGTATTINEIASLRNSTDYSRVLTFTAGGTGPESFWANSTPDDQTISWAQTGAIFASTPRPEAARLFISWVASKNFQAVQSRTQYALQTDGANPLLSNLTQTSGFRLFEEDRATVEWWKNQYEDVLGTPQGPSPLAVYPNPPYQT